MTQLQRRRLPWANIFEPLDNSISPPVSQTGGICSRYRTSKLPRALPRDVILKNTPEYAPFIPGVDLPRVSLPIPNRSTTGTEHQSPGRKWRCEILEEGYLMLGVL